jgi:hypothetical protein
MDEEHARRMVTYHNACFEMHGCHLLASNLLPVLKSRFTLTNALRTGCSAGAPVATAGTLEFGGMLVQILLERSESGCPIHYKVLQTLHNDSQSYPICDDPDGHKIEIVQHALRSVLRIQNGHTNDICCANRFVKRAWSIPKPTEDSEKKHPAAVSLVKSVTNLLRRANEWPDRL